MAPFEKGWRPVLQDRKFITYLILCLPFHENGVPIFLNFFKKIHQIENVIISLLFKFQGKKSFLVNFEQCVLDILNCQDSSEMAKEQRMFSDISRIDQDKVHRKLTDQIKHNFVPEVRQNMMITKRRCQKYLKKIYSIFEFVIFFPKLKNQNFLKPYLQHIIKYKSSINILDPFRVLFEAYNTTKEQAFKDDLAAQVGFYGKNELYRALKSEHINLINKQIRNIDGEKEESNSAVDHEDEHSFISSVSNSAMSSPRKSVMHEREVMTDCDSEISNNMSQELFGAKDQYYEQKVKLDMIHDWLFSEEVPYFNKNHYIKGYICNNDDLSIFFGFIQNPFKYVLHSKVLQKYIKICNNLNLEFKKTNPVNKKFQYRPEKHNSYYLRARRMMIVFLFKPNINTLMVQNRKCVDIFYKCLYEEVWSNERCKCNMDLVFKLIQFFLLCDLRNSMRNIIKYHIPYYLLGNIEIFGARLTLTCLITPGDIFFKIPENMLKILYRYFDESGYFLFYLEMMINFQQDYIEDKIKSMTYSEEFSDDHYEFDNMGDGGFKNPFLNLYHSFFNIRLLYKNHKQIEDYNMDKTNIDRIDLSKFKDGCEEANNKAAFRFSRQFQQSITESAKAEREAKKKDKKNQKVNFTSPTNDSNDHEHENKESIPIKKVPTFVSQYKATLYPNLVSNSEKSLDLDKSLNHQCSNNLYLPSKGGYDQLGSINKLDNYNTILAIDTCTEGYENPYKCMINNTRVMGYNQDKIEKIGDVNELNMGALEIFEENILIKAENERMKEKQGFLDQIIERMILKGKYNIMKLLAVNPVIQPCQLTSGIRKVRKVTRAIMMAKKQKTLAKISSLNKKAAMKCEGFNNFKVLMYNEKIKTVSADIVSILKNQDKLFGQYAQNETTAVHLADVQDNVINQCIILVNNNFFSEVNLPIRDPFILWDIILSNNIFLIKMFENYMIKINYSLENKVLFRSAMVSGRLINLMLKNLFKIMRNRPKRYELILLLKKNISFICAHINKSHKMYRMKQQDDVIKQPGSLTVMPFSDLRLLLVETLFNLVESDKDTQYQSLNLIHDSTYHLLFIFSMEKCHNNLYLSKFLRFLEILFNYGNDMTLLNAVIKINLLSDLSRFFIEFVHNEIQVNKYKDCFMFFFKELYLQIIKACHVSFFCLNKKIEERL